MEYIEKERNSNAHFEHTYEPVSQPYFVFYIVSGKKYNIVKSIHWMKKPQKVHDITVPLMYPETSHNYSLGY